MAYKELTDKNDVISSLKSRVDKDPSDTDGWQKLVHELSLLLEKERVYARKDPLTGLGNRREMEEYWEFLKSRPNIQEIDPSPGRKSAENGHCYMVSIIDLSMFKVVNDLFGHNVGDSVLKFVAEELNRSFRQALDGVFRVGGDEFVLIVEAGNGSEKVVENVRKWLEKILGETSERSIMPIVRQKVIDMHGNNNLKNNAHNKAVLDVAKRYGNRIDIEKFKLNLKGHEGNAADALDYILSMVCIVLNKDPVVGVPKNDDLNDLIRIADRRT